MIFYILTKSFQSGSSDIYQSFYTPGENLKYPVLIVFKYDRYISTKIQIVSKYNYHYRI